MSPLNPHVYAYGPHPATLSPPRLSHQTGVTLHLSDISRHHHCRHFHNPHIQHTCTGSCLDFRRFISQDHWAWPLRRRELDCTAARKHIPVSAHFRHSRSFLLSWQVWQKRKPLWKLFFSSFSNTKPLHTSSVFLRCFEGPKRSLKFLQRSLKI